MKTMILLTLCIFTSVHADDTAIQARLAGMARKISMDGFQVSSMGILGDARIYKPVPNKSKNKGAEKFLWQLEESHTAVLRGAKDAKAVKHTDATGQHLGIAPTSTIMIPWKGKVWRIGWVGYTSLQGVGLRAPLYTASETEALDFYRKHGFTAAARDAVMDAR